MSWIFHEPLEPAIYARRTVGPPVTPTSRAFGQHSRAIESLTGADVWREETEGWVNQRQAFAPLVARSGFSRSRSFHALDLWREDPPTVQRHSGAPIPPARALSRSRSFHSLDLWSEDALQPQHRAFAPPPILVVVTGFSRARSISSLDLFSEDLQPTQRWAYAPLRVIANVIAAYSPVRRLVVSLLASDAFDEFYLAQRPTRFVVGHVQPGPDMGMSESFTFTAAGTTSDNTLTFTGAGADPTVPLGMRALPLEGLGAGMLEIVADRPATTFGGQSASRIV